MTCWERSGQKVSRAQINVSPECQPEECRFQKEGHKEMFKWYSNMMRALEQCLAHSRSSVNIY